VNIISKRQKIPLGHRERIESSTSNDDRTFEEEVLRPVESRVPSGGFMKSTRAPEDAELSDHQVL
jgi:hypothetical protein